jgi:hypothetical protein
MSIVAERICELMACMCTINAHMCSAESVGICAHLFMKVRMHKSRGHVYIYIYVCVCVCLCIYVFIYESTHA